MRNPTRARVNEDGGLKLRGFEPKHLFALISRCPLIVLVLGAGAALGYGCRPPDASPAERRTAAPLRPIAARESAELVPLFAASGGRLGEEVALSDDGQRLAVGSPGQAVGGIATGAVYLYTRTATGGWTLEFTLNGPGSFGGEAFGRAVDINGDGTRVVVGSGETGLTGFARQGAVYVFDRVSPTFWQLSTTLYHSAPEAGDELGMSVDIEPTGRRLVAGAPHDDRNGVVDAGSARIFSETAGVWTEEAILAPSTSVGTEWGRDVALSWDGNFAVIGGPNAGVQGQAQVFRRQPSTGSWTLEATLTPPATFGFADFGSTLALSADMTRAAVASPTTTASTSVRYGSLAIYRQDPLGVWTFEAELLRSGPRVEDAFGASIALSFAGDTLLVGAPAVDPLGVVDAGASYLFTRTGTAWSSPVEVFAPSPGSGDAYGESVTLSLDATLGFVGAPGDQTINGPRTGSVRLLNLGAPAGDACTADAACISRSCVGGICCDRECDGLCEVCAVADGGSEDGRCGPIVAAAASVICRPAHGPCDLAERCVATSTSCPADTLASSRTVCRPSGGACDFIDYCTGTSTTCPPDDNRILLGSVCRSPVGACGVLERCGEGPVCPEDANLPAGARCRAPRCDGDTAVAAEFCTGDSEFCADETRTECAPYRCLNGACMTSCSSDGDCLGATYCRGDGVCAALLATGEACERRDQCESRWCVDGFCCGSRCDEQCEACNVDGVQGTCSPIEGAPRGSRSPCATDGSACGGACNGRLRTECIYPGSSQGCREASCSAGVAIFAARCRGDGTCPEPTQLDCAPLSCDGDTCASDCGGDEDCSEGSYCRSGICSPLEPLGASCSRNESCESSFCADGVCCDSACTEQCASCAEAGTEGTCQPRVGSPVGDRPQCEGGNEECGRRCDGVTLDGCVFAPPGLACGQICVADTAAATPGQCDGEGSCTGSERIDCGRYQCRAGSCPSRCRSDDDCNAPESFCDGGTCESSCQNVGGNPSLLVLLLFGAGWLRRRQRLKPER